MVISEYIRRSRSHLSSFMTGGEWALSLPANSRRNLTNFWLDGLFSAASDTIPINYLVLYLLALGGNSTQVGLFTALTSLAAAVCLLPGALLVEKFGHRKEITVWFGGISARLMLLILAFLPFGFTGQVLIGVVILVSVIRSAVSNLAFPAWMAITGDIVPIDGRGRYFGSRNFVMVVAGIIMTYLVGEFITREGSSKGYQLSLVLAFVVGLLSTFFFSRIKDHQEIKPEVGSAAVSLAEIIRDLRGSPVFLLFCFASALWNFFINVAAPFFNVHMVQNLHFTAVMVGIAAVATSVSKLFIQRKVGELSDRLGPGIVQLVSMFLISVLPFAWLFITELWHAVVLNIVAGVFWGAFELVSFNFLLQLTPVEKRARYSAIFQVVVTLALAGGAVVGSSIILQWGYTGIFYVSAIGRFVAAFFFLRMIQILIRQKQTG